MKRVYAVPENLQPVIEDVYKTLLEDCEKDVRIEVKLDAVTNAWFQVQSPGQKEDGILRVSGVIGAHGGYRLYINPVSACFDVDDKRFEVAEQMVYMFIHVMVFYRSMRRLPPLNTHIIDGLAAEDSPPVNAENYMEIPPEDKIDKLAALISKDFHGVSFTERHGIFCYYLCTLCPGPRIPPKYVQVCTDMIKSFLAAFPARQVWLLATRWAGVQRLYFVTEQGRLYCCKTDDSREFLKGYGGIISDIVSRSPFRPASLESRLSELSGKSFKFTID
jgi:hypothetical protein